MYTVIDLFAGAGGLSLGFEQTGKYIIKVAFENNPAMQETYKKNHPNVDVRGDVCVADYKEIIDEYGSIDIVIGGPPCQGFSNANRQKSHAINRNNLLVKEYIRAIQELQPKAFVMENVSMLKSDVHRFFLSHSDEKQIMNYGIKISEIPLLLLEKDCFFTGAEEISKNQSLVEKYLWTQDDFSVLNVIYKYTKNHKKFEKALEKHKKKLLTLISKKEYVDENGYINNVNSDAFNAIRFYFEGKLDSNEVAKKIKNAVCIQKMLNKSKEIFDNDLIVSRYDNENGLVAFIYSYAVYDYLKTVLGSPQNEYVITDKVICAADYGAPQKRMRFVVLGVKKTISEEIALPVGSFDKNNYRKVSDAIKDLEEINPVYDVEDDIHGITLPKEENLSDLAKKLRDSNILRNHIITKTTDIAMARFKAISEGGNFHSLSDEMKENTYTDVKRTQNTIYLRLKYDEPCGTVVNVRKSMWIHPKKNRAVSVREAARLQTFPDSFVFCGSKDKQYQQVGNAVPPMMAKAIAEKIASVLDKQGSDSID